MKVSLAALSRTQLYFLSVRETFEQVENMFIDEGWIRPYEILLKGIYYVDDRGRRMLEFTSAGPDIDDVELRVTSAFLHRREMLNFYEYPVLAINGRLRGPVSALVDGFIRGELSV